MPPISTIHKKKIQAVLSVFEGGTAENNYGALVVQRDGKNSSLQITYGKHQVTEQGNLKHLIDMYVKAMGKYSRELRTFAPFVGLQALYDNYTFRNLLIQAGADPVMQECQDKFFDQFYWDPAYQFFTRNGFTLPLSMLVIYDSFIQSGGILAFLRQRFAAMPPKDGGGEKAWIGAYTRERDEWLEGHRNPLLRSSDYRTDCLLEQILAGNWDLSGPVTCKFNSDKPHKWITVK